MARLDLPCLCLVTYRHQCKGRPLEEVVTLAVEGGVTMVQFREKDLEASELLKLAENLRDVTKGKALLFINDRVDVALACDADGVQLGESALPVTVARRVAGDRLLIGRSVHDMEGAARAEAEGADLLVAGAVFPTGSHPEVVPAGLWLLERIRAKVTIPYLAIGGVNQANVEGVIKAGASGAAVISAIIASNDPQEAARLMTERMAQAWSGVIYSKPHG